MIYFSLIGCLLFMILQGTFAASEISFISSHLLKLRNRQAKGDRQAAKVYRLILKPEKFLATTLVGTNISVVLSSSLLTFFLIKLGVKNVPLWTTVIFVPIMVIFAELIPKNLGRYLREDFSCRIVDVILFFEKVFAPLMVGIEKTTKFLIKLILGKVRIRSPYVTKDEIKSLVKEIELQGGIDRGEKEAIEEVFDFRSGKIKDVCIRIAKVVGLDYTDSYHKVLDEVKKHRFTRYPVFKNRQIAGYLNIYDVFYNPQEKWHSFVRQITKVGINQKPYEVFSLLKSKKESIALVFKGRKIYGIVTIQDLIRETITSIVKI